ncbi:MAG: TonB-dependent receptor [Kangiellaceae bacterium]|nr:TonB-dependent receptor [Kangiellaceae bacterium]
MFDRIEATASHYLTYLLAVIIVNLFVVKSSDAAEKAQTISEHTKVKNNIIIVSGNRFEQEYKQLPTHIDVIDQETIELSGASNLLQLLQQVAGVQVSNLSGKTIVSLRGVAFEQAANNVLVLLDGRRLNNTDIAAPDLETIIIERIKRIEIVQGSATSLYGDQAVAGVINVITKSPNNQSAKFTVAAGSYHNRLASVDVNFSGDNGWKGAFSGYEKRTDNYREHNEQKQKQVAMQLGYIGQSSNWNLEIIDFKEHLQTPGALLEEDLISPRLSRDEFANDFVNTDRVSYQFNSSHQLSESWQFGLDINHSDSNIESINSFIGFATDTVNSTERSQLGVYPRIKKVWVLEEQRSDARTVEWIAGMDIDHNDYDFSLLSRGNQQKALSIYSYLSIPFLQSMNLNLAGRYSKVKDELTDAFSYAQGVNLDNKAHAFDIGLNYEVSNQLQAYARWSKNFRFAKVDEQAYTSPNIIGLNPQRGYSTELGISYLENGHQFKASIYQLKLKDEIFFDPNATEPVGAFFPGANVNGQSSSRNGLIVSYEFNPLQFISLGLNYHYVDAILVVDSKKYQLPGVAKQTANGWVNWAVVDDLDWRVEVNYRGGRYQDGDAVNALPQVNSYALVNSSLSWNLDSWRLSLRLDNIFNKSYIDYAQFNGFYPAAGRHGVAKISYQF